MMRHCLPHKSDCPSVVEDYYYKTDRVQLTCIRFALVSAYVSYLFAYFVEADLSTLLLRGKGHSLVLCLVSHEHFHSYELRASLEKYPFLHLLLVTCTKTLVHRKKPDYYEMILVLG